MTGLILLSGRGIETFLGPLLMSVGFGGVVSGFILATLVSILRVLLDRTAFVARGLDDAERLRLIEEAEKPSAAPEDDVGL